MSDKEAKKAIKEIEKKLVKNKKDKTLTQDEVWELEDKLGVLKHGLNKEKKEEAADQ